MDAESIVYSMNCCAPSRKVDRDCASCPFSSYENCHEQLIMSAIDLITNERATVEHYANEINRIQGELASLSIK